MQFIKALGIGKTNKIEIAFFLIYFPGVALLSNLEYNYWEKNTFGITNKELEFALVYGIANIVSFLIYYKALKFCLKREQPWMFIVLIIGFLVFYFLFKKASYYLIYSLDFLSDEIRNNAIKWFHLKRLGYTISYLIMDLAGVSFLAYFTYAARQSEELREIKEQKLLSELSILKAQLQPHFFFNTLNNIYSLALAKADDTAPLVAKLAEMMRYMLYTAEKSRVLLVDEIAFIKNYVEVEHIRYRSAISIHFDTQGIDAQSTIVPLLILPFIENAFKHGIQDEEQEGFVKIVICKTGSELILEVSNSMSKNKVSYGGIGLLNVRKRLAILYPQQHQLQIENNGEVHFVSLTLEI